MLNLFVNNVVSDTNLSSFMTLISSKIPTLFTSNMTHLILMTEIHPNLKQVSSLAPENLLFPNSNSIKNQLRLMWLSSLIITIYSIFICLDL